MNKKWLLIVLALTVIPIFTACPVLWYSDYDVHYSYNQNTSSHNIFIQYYMEPDSQAPRDVYSAYGNALAKNSGAEGLYGIVGPGSDSVLAKILIIDTDSHKLLKKIDRNTFYAMLTKEISVEKNSHEKVTWYKYYFTITDEFLENHE
ncbi:MAG: hypothetical protein LBT14_03160 [Treponema sp.]|jgi:hypothetical protein|nr:hypothetical protein [Treponema sp.]